MNPGHRVLPHCNASIWRSMSQAWGRGRWMNISTTRFTWSCTQCLNGYRSLILASTLELNSDISYDILPELLWVCTKLIWTSMYIDIHPDWCNINVVYTWDINRLNHRLHSVTLSRKRYFSADHIFAPLWLIYQSIKYFFKPIFSPFPTFCFPTFCSGFSV